MNSLLVAVLLAILPPPVTHYAVYEMWIPERTHFFNGGNWIGRGQWVVVHFVNGKCLLDGKRLHDNIVRTAEFRKVQRMPLPPPPVDAK